MPPAVSPADRTSRIMDSKPLMAKDLFDGQVSFKPEELRPEKPLKLFFVAPPGSLLLDYGKLATVATELPWLGMAYAAAAARAAGHDVVLQDYQATREGYDAVERDIRGVQPDVVLMANFITNTERCLKVAEIAKSVNPATKVIFGGPQPTIFPEQSIDHDLVDVVTYRESEISLARLLQCLNDGKSAWREVPGLVFRDGDEYVKTVGQPLINDMDSIPIPALDLYPMDRYFPAVYIRGKRVGNYVTSRGCPYECTYCEAKMTFGRTFRFHSTERVISDIKYMTHKWGFDSYQFYDDIFTTNRKRVIDLCEGFLREDLNIKWMCWTRTNLVDPELMDIMKKAGCYLIFFGCESGSQEMLDRIKKNLTVETNYKGIKIVRDSGMKSFSSFMIGLPGETKDQVQDTIDFTLKSELDYASIFLLEPYPGTEIWDDALKNGRLVADENYSNQMLTNFNEVWVPNGFTREELVKLQNEAMDKFYLRPKILWSWVKEARHLGFRRLMRGFYGGFQVLIADKIPGVPWLKSLFEKKDKQTNNKRF